MNKKRLIIGAIILIALAFLVWFFILRTKKKEEEVVIETSNEVDPFPLKYGKAGKEVKQAQMAAKFKLLREDGVNNSFPIYGCDGEWGTETSEWMLRAFKRDNISKEFFNKTLMGNVNADAF